MRNLTGVKVGRLTVVKPTEERRNKSVVWEAVCDCGTTTKVSARNLTSSRPTQSCGCYHIDNIKSRCVTHGMRDSSEYAVWRSMKARCLNPNHKSYKHYGAKGISVCSDWANDFAKFIADMGVRPSSKHTLERLKYSEGYNKINCVWATHKTQARNRRSNTVWEHEGEKLCVSEWAERLDILPETLLTRVYKLGWDIQKTLSTPVRKNKRDGASTTKENS